MYNRWKAVEYAHKWAYKRNPAYLDFTGIGGDCTNFISQCLHAGGAAMNYKRDTGWYYSSASNRAPAWTSVQFLYRFLMNNKGVGPYASEVEAKDMEVGDVVQLAFEQGAFSHSLLVVQIGQIPELDNILIATHSYDSDYRKLSSYEAVGQMRFLKISVR